MRRFQLGVAVLVSFCSTDDPANVEGNETGNNLLNAEKVTEKKDTKIHPNRSAYDLVIVDSDFWEILLNVERIRANTISYSGHLWYQAGAYYFQGPASAVYNKVQDIMSVTALDSGWDRGHILYSLKLKDRVSFLSFNVNAADSILPVP